VKSGPLAWLADAYLDLVGFGIVAVLLGVWIAALVVWRWLGEGRE